MPGSRRLGEAFDDLRIHRVTMRTRNRRAEQSGWRTLVLVNPRRSLSAGVGELGTRPFRIHAFGTLPPGARRHNQVAAASKGSRLHAASKCAGPRRERDIPVRNLTLPILTGDPDQAFSIFESIGAIRHGYCSDKTLWYFITELSVLYRRVPVCRLSSPAACCLLRVVRPFRASQTSPCRPWVRC